MPERSSMAAINLNPVGIDQVVSLEGDVALHPGTGPVVFLMAESHTDNITIGQNLQSAINLLDAGVVEVVGIEEYSSSTDIKAELSAKSFVRRDGSLTAYSEGLKRQFDGDAGVIGAVKSARSRMNFGDQLVFLRPNVKIVGVEDPALRSEAQRASEAIAHLFPEEQDPAKRRQLQIAKFREDGAARELKRDAAFVSNVIKAREASGSEKAVVINGGGRHMQRIAGRLAQEGKAYVLIVPEGYKDAVEG